MEAGSWPRIDPIHFVVDLDKGMDFFSPSLILRDSVLGFFYIFVYFSRINAFDHDEKNQAFVGDC